MLFGADGLGLHFDNIGIAQIIGTVSLSAILFSGGLDTRFDDIKPVLGPGIMLATVGVLLTALSTGFILYGILDRHLGVSLMGCLLLAATMSSTDSASVFSILRGKGLNLKHNLRPTLELESGANDPMAYVLVLTFISLVQQGGSPQWGSALVMLVVQLAVGAMAGWLFGKGIVWVVNKINIDNVALYPILVLSGSFFVFAATFYMKGNSYLAVYIAGLVVGNSHLVHKRSTRNFFDGVTWLAQLSMFLTLGLLVNPSELKSVLIPGLIISFVMIFISRPLSVFVSMVPFREYTFKDRLFVSWVGLRGTVHEASFTHGNRLMDMQMPEQTLVIMVRRGDNYFVPTGSTILHVGDHLMILTDNQQALSETLRRLGISDNPPEKPRRDWRNIFFDDSET